MVFSEPVTGFTASDVTLSGTALPATATITDNSLGYTVSVSGMSTSGDVIAGIPAGAAINASNQPNTASTSTEDPDSVDYTLPPSVTIDQDTSQADPTAMSPILFDVVFSEAVTGFGDSNSDMAVGGTANPTAATIIINSSTSYTVRVSGMTASGTVIATIPDGAATSVGTGAPSAASTSTDDTVTYNRPFTVKINLNGLVSDGTSVSPIKFDVLFSDPVAGFGDEPGDITLSGTAGATTATATVTPTDNGTTSYTVEVSGMTGAGTVIAALPPGAATSIANGDPSPASTSNDNSVFYDLAATSSSPSGSPTCSTAGCSASASAFVTAGSSTTAAAIPSPTTAAISSGGGVLASTGATSRIGVMLGLLLVIGGTGLALAGRRAGRRHSN